MEVFYLFHGEAGLKKVDDWIKEASTSKLKGTSFNSLEE
jgi:hypothetical protein